MNSEGERCNEWVTFNSCSCSDSIWIISWTARMVALGGIGLSPTCTLLRWVARSSLPFWQSKIWLCDGDFKNYKNAWKLQHSVPSEQANYNSRRWWKLLWGARCLEASIHLMATTVLPYASRPLEIFYPKPIKGLGSFYFRRHEHSRARAALCDLCKLHKFSPQKCRNFVQYFSPKTIDFLRSMWYNIIVKRK